MGNIRPLGSEKWWVLAFLAPTLLGLLLGTFGSIFATIGISFANWDLLTPAVPAGISNYTGLGGDRLFMKALFNTLKFAGLYVPLTIVIIFLLLYLNFRRLTETLIVMLSVPFSLVGGIWLMYFLGYDLSVAVAVGFIALGGVAAEIGVIMLIYIDHALEAIAGKRKAAGEQLSAGDIYDAVIQGALLRVRPIMMTVFAITAGLLPIMWGSGTGSEVMRRIAAPMVGGMVSATILTLVVIPAIYALVKEYGIRSAQVEKR